MNSMSDTLPTRSRLIILQSGRILLIRRQKNDAEPYWVFPGGGVEARETPEQAAMREAREELGIEIEILRPFLSLTHAMQGSEVTEQFFVAKVIGGMLGTGKGAEFSKADQTYNPEWIALERLSTLPLHPQKIRDAVMRSNTNGLE